MHLPVRTGSGLRKLRRNGKRETRIIFSLAWKLNGEKQAESKIEKEEEKPCAIENATIRSDFPSVALLLQIQVPFSRLFSNFDFITLGIVWTRVDLCVCVFHFDHMF